MKINRNAKNLKIGDKVVTDFYPNQSDIVRSITSIHVHEDRGSGYAASVDGGEPCPLCKRISGTPIESVDAAWFIPFEKANEQENEEGR